MTQPVTDPTHTVSRAGYANPLTLDLKVTEASFVNVYVDDALLDSAEYSITGLGSDDGIAITIPAATSPAWFPDAASITVAFEPPISQPFDLSAGGVFGRAFENAIDAVVRIILSIKGGLDRTLKVPHGVEGDMTLPTPVPNASVVWNETGTGFINGPDAAVILTASEMSIIATEQALIATEAAGVSVDARDAALAAAASLNLPILNPANAGRVLGVTPLGTYALIKRHGLYMQETETWLDYLDRFNIATPQRSVLKIIDEFIELEMSEGIWQKHDIFDLFVGPSTAAISVNMKAPGTFNPSLVNAPIFAPYKGVKGDGGGAHVLLGYAPNQLTHYKRDDAHVMLATADSDVDGRSAYASTAGVLNLSITPRSASGNLVARLNSDNIASYSVSESEGFVLVNRTSEAEFSVEKNGVLRGVAAQPSTAPHASQMALLRNGSVYSRHRALALSVGAGLTANQREAHYSFVQNLLLDLGAY